MPGQQVGPNVFPMVVGAGLVLCGVLIALGIGRQLEDEAEADLAAIEGPPVEAARPSPACAPSSRRPCSCSTSLAADRLGFIVTAAIVVLATALALGARLAPRRCRSRRSRPSPSTSSSASSCACRCPPASSRRPGEPAMSAFLEGLRLVAAPDVLIALVLASIYGLVVGSLPGLSATMATALLVPVTFYLSPMAAVATIIAASAMAIFSGDIPGCLLRIPGTPASAAYTDEAYAMTRKGQPELALGICLWFSALGGIAGTLSLILLAPALAEMALSFSTFEYFWLAFLGLMCATLVARSSPVKAIASMLLGLLIACIGIENPAGTPRFTFGLTDLLGGIEVDPGAGRRVRRLGGHAGHDHARAPSPAAAKVRVDPRRAMGADQALPEAAGARQHRRHHHRRAAGRRRRHGGLGLLRARQALLEGAGEVRHRASGRAGRGRRLQQRLASPPAGCPR